MDAQLLAPTALAWVLLGSAIGGCARYAVSGWVARCCGNGFPWATLVVNVRGAGLIGLLAGVLGERTTALEETAVLLLVYGLLGSYTTVSSFSLQTLGLMRDGAPLHAASNVLLSVALCLLAAWGGWWIGGAAL